MTFDGRFDDHDHEDETPDDTAADQTAEVSCPYCGEVIEIALDPGGGAVQQYVEDCQVCCRPLTLRVRYGRDGTAQVVVEAEDDGDGNE